VEIHNIGNLLFEGNSLDLWNVEKLYEEIFAEIEMGYANVKKF